MILLTLTRAAKIIFGPQDNSPNNDTQTKSTMVCHKQEIGTTKMN